MILELEEETGVSINQNVVDIFLELFKNIILLCIPTAGQPRTGIEGFKYQASDG